MREVERQITQLRRELRKLAAGEAENRICPAAVTWEKQMWADLYQQYSLRPNG